MRRVLAALLIGAVAVAMASTADAKERTSSSSHASKPHYKNEGGHYAGGRGSSHKGGHYKNPRTHDKYTKHKKSSEATDPSFDKMIARAMAKGFVDGLTDDAIAAAATAPTSQE